jgi:hypothetical protein
MFICAAQILTLVDAFRVACYMYGEAIGWSVQDTFDYAVFYYGRFNVYSQHVQPFVLTVALELYSLCNCSVSSKSSYCNVAVDYRLLSLY